MSDQPSVLRQAINAYMTSERNDWRELNALIDRADRIEQQLIEARDSLQYARYHGWSVDRDQLRDIDAALAMPTEDR